MPRARRTISTTVWLERNSQTPSVAITMKACLSVSVTFDISGCPTTPISSATAKATHTLKA